MGYANEEITLKFTRAQAGYIQKALGEMALIYGKGIYETLDIDVWHQICKFDEEHFPEYAKNHY